MAEVNRMLRAFQRDPNDEFVGEWPIRDLELADLQELFGETNEMYGCYPVRGEHVAALASAAGIDIDIERYDYFVEADAV